VPVELNGLGADKTNRSILVRKAKIYIFLNATLGVWILGTAMAQARPEGSLRYLCYLVGAVLTSRLKVRLPGITGTMSVNIFFILIAIIELDCPQVLAIACAGTLGQMLWHASKKPWPVQMVFNLSSIVVAPTVSAVIALIELLCWHFPSSFWSIVLTTCISAS